MLISTGLFLIQHNLSSHTFTYEFINQSYLNKGLVRYLVVGALLADTTLKIVDRVLWTQQYYDDKFL